MPVIDILAWHLLWQVYLVGEVILTIGRAIHFARQGSSMVINVAPYGCMPGTLSSSILLEIKKRFDIPFISLFYDGDINVNDKVAALLNTINIEETRYKLKPEIIKRSQISEPTSRQKLS
jgi:predicted nucleotide-binding protein (sugar kinase/HSP70/actin superfamily)